MSRHLSKRNFVILNKKIFSYIHNPWSEEKQKQRNSTWPILLPHQHPQNADNDCKHPLVRWHNFEIQKTFASMILSSFYAFSNPKLPLIKNTQSVNHHCFATFIRNLNKNVLCHFYFQRQRISEINKKFNLKLMTEWTAVSICNENNIKRANSNINFQWTNKLRCGILKNWLKYNLRVHLKKITNSLNYVQIYKYVCMIHMI